jgi:malonyl-CoA O-methyltransferase
MRDEYDKSRRDRRLPVTVEVVYGHAWRGRRALAADGRQIVRFERDR